ncbi:helix-turn-helix domain-containing protein [Pelosinus sp. UFO1]|uniref:helix-turn-helix domain-containing protein n=1 Tax=Pelosinus sp. UFO1 TaxID=484770 RepID=UPI0004D1A803|nr:helix-turn-helix transcriptional regulator [Pelosinus sp. UFO1]AIF54162.1 helix-turn-helix domain protein [Pelosinus sp. UFO1]
MSLGERLSQLRNAKDLTQEEAAKLLNISRSRIALYETNRRDIDTDTLRRLADFYNTTTDYLIGRDNITLLSSTNETTTHKDLIKFLDQPEVSLDGMLLTKEDKAKIKASLDIIFWDIKQKKKQEES